MSRQRGFSIIELMVTIAVMAILLAAAGPSMSDFVRKNRIAASTNGLIQAVNYSRAEALRSGYPVTLCPTADASAATPACAGSTSWNGDLIVLDETGALKQAFQFGSDQMSVTAPIAQLVFRPNGSIDALAANQSFDLHPTGCKSKEARQINISRLGRITSKEVACP